MIHVILQAVVGSIVSVITYSVIARLFMNSSNRSADYSADFSDRYAEPHEETEKKEVTRVADTGRGGLTLSNAEYLRKLQKRDPNNRKLLQLCVRILGTEPESCGQLANDLETHNRIYESSKQINAKTDTEYGTERN